MRRTLFIVLLAILQVEPFFSATKASEPSYQGKPANYWFDLFVKELGSITTNGSVAAFQAMGSNAIPFLVRILETKPTKLAELGDEAVSKLADQPRLRKLAEKGLPSAYQINDRRRHAAYLISEIGTNAGAAMPVLLKIFEDQTEDWRLTQEVYSALVEIGESGAGAVSRYIEYLKGDVDSQVTGANLLGSVGPKAKAAVPLLLEAVNGTNRQLCWAAAQALWSIDRQTNVALRTFVNGLQSTNGTERQFALIYLRKMGPAAKDAGSAIVPALQDEDSSVRREAELALRLIDPDLLETTVQKINSERAVVVEKLVHLLKSQDPKERLRAVEVIGLFGPDARPAVGALIEILVGSGSQFPAPFAAIGLMNARREAAVALGEIGVEAQAAVPVLVRLVSDSEDYFVAFYCKALGRIGPGAKEAVAALEARLGDENPGVRLAAADALTRILPEGSSNAVATLRVLQHDPDLATVWAIGDKGIAHQMAKKDFQNPQSVFFRLAASIPLWRLGLEKGPPVDAILKELGKPENSNSSEYIELLGEIGPEAKAALPLLENILETNRGSRRLAAMVVRRIDPNEAARLGLPGLLGVP